MRASAAAMLARVEGQLKVLAPAYFALVMATGIVSLAAELLGARPLAIALFAFNLGAYLVLWALTVARLLRYRSEFLEDLIDHQRGPGFLTMVAGTCVLGSEMIVIGDRFTIAAVLFALGIVLWVLLTYTIFTAFTIKQEKPSLAEGISVGWLLAVVATQSIAVLASLLAEHWEQPLRLYTNFFALSMWLWGGMLYIWVISLIFYRYMFFRFSPGDIAPPYWINMGAMAISVLAGSLLISNRGDAPFLDSLTPFLEGFTVFYWATGTWWIPMIAILAVWRHVYRRFPLSYDPLYWGAVFPLGMYAVATHEMAAAMNLEFLDGVTWFFFGVAIVTWLLTFVGLIRAVGRVLRPPAEAGLPEAR